MKPFGCAFISSIALSAAAKPLLKASNLRLNDRDTVTTEEVNTLEFYAQYAAAGYCNSEDAVGAAVTCSSNACPDVEAAGATVDATFSGTITDVSGFVATDDTNQLIVVSIKGSQSIRNWITDFIFLQTSCDLVTSCLVHSGFYTAWNEIKDDLLAGVEAAVAANPTYSVFFTGHSLGGAVSTIAVAYAREANVTADLYTFGSPRVGNEKFVSFVTDQAGAEYRVTHLDDPVPRLPPIILNYRHTSPEYWLSDGNATTTDYTAADIKVCDGYANTACNAGTSGLDTDAHTYYFEDISACSEDGLTFRRRSTDGLMAKRDNVTWDMATTEPTDVTDAELLQKLNAWVADDIEEAATLST
ncbi:alpha/beta-hydrolase [Xylariaceae sp. FL0016]|nr:alpha/beta-hydrolase [Xylariaceae sp. FL0016]